MMPIPLKETLLLFFDISPRQCIRLKLRLVFQRKKKREKRAAVWSSLIFSRTLISDICPLPPRFLSRKLKEITIFYCERFILKFSYIFAFLKHDNAAEFSFKPMKWPNLLNTFWTITNVNHKSSIVLTL